MTNDNDIIIYLVRHGQTEGNVNEILQGQTHGNLTTEGRSQAERLSLSLATEQVDFFVSSDLRRAVETCEIIARRHGAEVVTTPLLRERDWGNFTGKYIPELKDKVWPDNVETLEQIKYRAGQFINQVINKYQGKSILVVGHGIINKFIQSLLLNCESRDIERMDNAELRIYRLSASSGATAIRATRIG